MLPRHSIFYNSLLLTAINLLLRGISMSFQVFLSDRIGAEGLGLLQLVLTVGGFAMTLGLSGVRTAAMYLCAEEHGRRRCGGVKRAMELCMAYGAVCSTLAAIALWYGAPALALQWVRDLRAVSSLRLLALSLPVNCLVSVLCGYFTACNRIRSLVLVEVAERLISLLLTFLLLVFWAKGDTSRSCCAIVAGNALATAGSALWMTAMMLHDFRGCNVPAGLQMPRRLMKLCVPLALGDYLRSGLNTLEQFLIPAGLARFTGSSTAAMADYGTIHGMVFPILMFPAAVLFALSDLLIPELARCRAQADSRRVRHLTDKCLRMGLVFACGVAALMYLLADGLGMLFYSSAEVGMWLRRFAPLVPILYADAIVDGMCKGLGQQVACVRNNITTSVLDVVFLYLLLPRWGMSGYFFTFTVNHIVNFYLSLRLLLGTTGYTPSLRFVIKVVLCVGFACVLCRPLPQTVGMPMQGILFCGAFLPLLQLTGAFTQDDRRWLGHVVRGKKSIDIPAKTPYNSSKDTEKRAI